MRIRKIGEISYAELDSETQTDVSYAIGFKTGEVREEGDQEALANVTIRLQNGPSVLPLVLVDPAALLRSSQDRAFSKVVARKYAAEMRAGAKFPPIVIDSDKRTNVLVEGGHRTLAATIAGLSEIPAIDIAGARIAPVWEGGERFETYDFKRRRSEK